MTDWIDTVCLPENWSDLRIDSDANASRQKWLIDELRRELGPDHSLATLHWQLIAACNARDDVLLDLGDGHVAITHLTFTSSPPERPPWPDTATFASEAEITAEWESRD